jgi:hypothetical protein
MNPLDGLKSPRLVALPALDDGQLSAAQRFALEPPRCILRPVRSHVRGPCVNYGVAYR